VTKLANHGAVLLDGGDAPAAAAVAVRAPRTSRISRPRSAWIRRRSAAAQRLRPFRRAETVRDLEATPASADAEEALAESSEPEAGADEPLPPPELDPPPPTPKAPRSPATTTTARSTRATTGNSTRPSFIPCRSTRASRNAQGATGANLFALCLDQDARVVSALIENAEITLDHLRMLAFHHRTGTGLEILARAPTPCVTSRSSDGLLRNPQTPETVLGRLLAAKSLLQTYKILVES